MSANKISKGVVGKIMGEWVYIGVGVGLLATYS